MKRILVVLLVAFASFSANAIFVDAENDQASKDLGASFHFLGCAAGWDTEGGTRYGTGSCVLICNNEADGAWILTAAHAALRETTGETWNIQRYCFLGNYYDGFPKGTTGFLPDATVAAVRDKVFYHPTQDIALVKLEHLVYEADGTLTSPAELYSGHLTIGIPLLFAGCGRTGLPSDAGVYATGIADGCARGARATLVRFDYLGMRLSYGYMQYDSGLQIPGVYGANDSGGFTAVEQDGKILIVGINSEVRGSGTYTSSGFERLDWDANFQSWMYGIIAANGNGTLTGAVTINDGAEFSTSPDATLTLSASEAKTLTATNMRFSNDGVNWSSWEAYATSKSWTLSEGDGSKTVYVQFQDSNENVSQAFSDSIVLDTTAPLTESQAVSTHMNSILGITLVGSDVTSSPVTFAVTAGPANGVLSGVAPTLTYTPNTNFVGTDSVSYEVTDGAGNTATATVTITVTNAAAVANAGRNQQKLVGQLVTLDGSASTDVDGDALSYSWSIVSKPAGSKAELAVGNFQKLTFTADVPGTFSVQLTVSDGATQSAPSEVVIAVTEGTVSVNNGKTLTNSQAVSVSIIASNGTGEDAITEMRLSADGSTWYEWEPFATPITWELSNGDGLKSVFVQVRDAAQNASAVFSGSIVLDMTPPTAQPQSVSLHMNDSVGITLTGSDVMSAPVSISVVKDPAHGTYSAGIYTPNTNYVGDDALTYSVTDAAGNSSTVVVSITVTDQAPVVSNQSVTTNQGQAVAVVLSASDPDGDAVTVSVVAGPAHGTLTGTGANLSYTPQAGYTGSDSFTYAASDGALTSSVGTVSITVNSVVTTGSLTVTLQPSSAISAGGWAVDGGAWHTSGETVTGLTAGKYVVTFKPIAVQAGGGCHAAVNWETPADQTVVVVSGQTARVVGTYVQAAKTLKAEVIGGLGDSLLLLLMVFGCCKQKAVEVALLAIRRG